MSVYKCEEAVILKDIPGGFISLFLPVFGTTSLGSKRSFSYKNLAYTIKIAS